MPGLRLVIVGDGPERAFLETMVRENDLRREVSITGWLPREEVYAYYARASLLVVPSAREGLPWVALEAMSMGLPVLATRVGGLPELIIEEPDNARTGFLVDSGEPGRLEQVIEQVLATPEVRRSLTGIGLRARTRIRVHFSAELEIRKLTELYMEISTGRSGECV